MLFWKDDSVGKCTMAPTDDWNLVPNSITAAHNLW